MPNKTREKLTTELNKYSHIWTATKLLTLLQGMQIRDFVLWVVCFVTKTNHWYLKVILPCVFILYIRRPKHSPWGPEITYLVNLKTSSIPKRMHKSLVFNVFLFVVQIFLSIYLGCFTSTGSMAWLHSGSTAMLNDISKYKLLIIKPQKPKYTHMIEDLIHILYHARWPNWQARSDSKNLVSSTEPQWYIIQACYL